jgi:DNA sulfur modification protein DndC
MHFNGVTMGKCKTKEPKNIAKSAFDELGFVKTVELLTENIQALYLADEIPWVLGYSGGKDSTTVVQLVWYALRGLKQEQRKKHVYIISTDTQVENPVVARWVRQTLETMTDASKSEGLPITTHPLKPKTNDSFWVNLLGKGYPAPRPKFRWCTVRLKINPSGEFISRVVKSSGEAIVVLGMRKAESNARARVMEKHAATTIKESLTRNANLPNSLMYTPIENWSNDDVWMYLLHIKNPWGFDNKDLVALYKGASEGGECPLIYDTSLPTCGDSRFGCWVCTMVGKDKSMSAMIQNDEEKKWMTPLLKFRDEELAVQDDRPLRDFRRMSGQVQLYYDRPIPGPYLQHVREDWLRKLLTIQKQLQENNNIPETVRQSDIISIDELQEIRKIWVLDKHELEDSLPQIYEGVYGTPYPGTKLDDTLIFKKDDMDLLKSASDGDRFHYELVRELIDVERQNRNKQRRVGLFDTLEASLKRGFYANEQDATDFARKLQQTVQHAQDNADNRITISVTAEEFTELP